MYTCYIYLHIPTSGRDDNTRIFFYSFERTQSICPRGSRPIFFFFFHLLKVSTDTRCLYTRGRIFFPAARQRIDVRAVGMKIGRGVDFYADFPRGHGGHFLRDCEFCVLFDARVIARFARERV